MKHVASFLVAGLLFVLTSVLLWLGRASLGTSTPFLLVIVGGYLAAMTLAFPTQMGAVRDQVVAWYRAWKAP